MPTVKVFRPVRPIRVCFGYVVGSRGVQRGADRLRVQVLINVLVFLIVLGVGIGTALFYAVEIGEGQVRFVVS